MKQWWFSKSPEWRRVALLVAFVVLIAAGLFAADRYENSRQDHRADETANRVIHIEHLSPCIEHPNSLECFVAHAAATRQTTAAQACYIMSTITAPRVMGEDFPICESPKVVKQIERETRLLEHGENRSPHVRVHEGGDASNSGSTGHSQPGPSGGRTEHHEESEVSGETPKQDGDDGRNGGRAPAIREPGPSVEGDESGGQRHPEGGNETATPPVEESAPPVAAVEGAVHEAVEQVTGAAEEALEETVCPVTGSNEVTAPPVPACLGVK